MSNCQDVCFYLGTIWLMSGSENLSEQFHWLSACPSRPPIIVKLLWVNCLLHLVVCGTWNCSEFTQSFLSSLLILSSRWSCSCNLTSFSFFLTSALRLFLSLMLEGKCVGNLFSVWRFWLFSHYLLAVCVSAFWSGVNFWLGRCSSTVLSTHIKQTAEADTVCQSGLGTLSKCFRFLDCYRMQLQEYNVIMYHMVQKYYGNNNTHYYQIKTKWVQKLFQIQQCSISI